MRTATRTLSGVSVVVALSGCVLIPTPDASSSTGSPTPSTTTDGNATGTTARAGTISQLDRVDALVAAELSDVFANAFEPLTTTVQVPSEDSNPARTHLVEALVERGFGIQRVPADQGAHFLAVTREIGFAPRGQTGLKWRASIGTAEVRRDYALSDDGTLSTASPFRVAGIRTDIRAEDLERQEPMVVESAHRRIDYRAPDISEVSSPVISLVTPELVARVAQDVSRSSGQIPGSGPPTVNGLNSSRVETGNLFYDSDGNFGSTLDELDRIERRIVVFANDSMKIGPDNREMLREFVESAVERNDVISLVGCSNGPTTLEIGNEGLALGRARRVSEELIMHGIARERIYDEGCWAPVSASDRFPGRGVVVELWREPA